MANTHSLTFGFGGGGSLAGVTGVTSPEHRSQAYGFDDPLDAWEVLRSRIIADPSIIPDERARAYWIATCNNMRALREGRHFRTGEPLPVDFDPLGLVYQALGLVDPLHPKSPNAFKKAARIQSNMASVFAKETTALNPRTKRHHRQEGRKGWK